MYDVVIIGGGVVGCSIARELSRYRLKICLLEKCPDVAEGTSKANSAIIHAGFDAKPGSLKAKLNVAGNAMFDKLAKELDLNFKRNGSLVVCFSQEDMPRLEKLAESGRANGVSGLAILDAGQVRRLEPNLSEHVAAALYAPSGAIICPYEFTIALAENAQANGVEFRLNEKVVSIKKNGGSFKIGTVSGAEYAASVVINAAGLFSDA
jgi:glycerol-3-phosphate dehydrogenase